MYKRKEPEEDEYFLLLRAIYNSNIPKFVGEDIELFSGITADLFPGVELRGNAEDEMKGFIVQAMDELDFGYSENMVLKTMQLHEILIMRHGVMVIGESFSCKSSMLKVLQKALDLQSKSNIRVTWIYVKAITVEQLYGETDLTSYDWIDGIFSHHLKLYVQITTKEKKWIVFDGAVDSIWIETMNTVLDDNRKLCLTSGEIIKLTPEISMIFEVDDLSAASPATISRCGMVYASRNELLSNENLLHEWLQNLPLAYKYNTFIEIITDCFRSFIPKLFEFLFEESSEIFCVKISAPWLLKNFFKLYESFLLKNSKNKMIHNQEFLDKQEKLKRETELHKSDMKQNSMKGSTVQSISQKLKKDLLSYNFWLSEDQISLADKSDCISKFILSMIWTFGVVIKERYRRTFSSFISSLYSSVASSKAVPLSDYYNNAYDLTQDCFNVYYNSEKKRWEPWTLTSESTIKSSHSDIHNLHVSTLDTAAYMFILKSTIPRGFSTVITGETGTGKTLISNKLMNEILSDNESFQSTSFMLSPRSSATQLQEQITSKLIRRRKGVYGPEIGKSIIIVVDDLHIPVKEEETGAQAPIEVLRQALDKQEWYNRQNCDKFLLEDLIILGISSQRHEITQRFLRHLFLINFSEFTDDSLGHIFGSYLSLGFSSHLDFVKKSIKSLASRTIEIYRQSVKFLPPTPTKSHYQFNLRDISNVCKGMISVPTHLLTDSLVLYRLWVHECLRVFSDRLVTDSDKEIFRELLETSLRSSGKQDLTVLSGEMLMFCNFMDERVYQQCTSMDNAREVLENSLAKYNSDKSRKELNLVFFEYAVDHIARICRILGTPKGNGILIGLSGSGRYSLATLSAFTLGYTTYHLVTGKSYSVVEWYDDLKKFLHTAGIENKPSAFILRESDLKSEIFLENINNLLNSGEIPNLYTKEEKENIMASMKDASKASLVKTTEGKYQHFVSNVQKNFHILICLSPSGDGLRTKFRLFPSLVTCCTIDWFTDWPEEALVSLAVNEIERLGIPLDAQERQDTMKICVNFHQTAKELSSEYFREKKRLNYVIPCNYLKLFANIKSLYSYKEATSISIKVKYLRGVEMLVSAQEDVKKISEELTVLKPQLEQKTRETEELMHSIRVRNNEAEVQRNFIEAEQRKCAIDTEEAEKIKQECQEILAKAEPELEEAKQALDTLDKNELTIVRNLPNPPILVKFVVESVVILIGEAPKRVLDPNDRTKVLFDYWEAGKKVMKKTNFIKRLLMYDKSKLTENIVRKLRDYINNKDFTPEIVKHKSTAAEGLCKWVRAIYNYYHISRDIIPKKAAYQRAEIRLAEKIEILNEKERELVLAEQKIQELEADLTEKNGIKDQLQMDIQKCEDKMKRAVRLLDKLHDEQARWAGKVSEMTKILENIIGDILLSAGSVSYLGNFTGSYREKIISASWVNFITDTVIKCSLDFSLRTIIGDPVLIDEWGLNGLPNDTVSIENAIIIELNTNWPLMIDPQSQASKWIKTMYRNDQGFRVLHPNSHRFLNIIEDAMGLGHVILLENVGEHLDSSLDPLLNREFLRDGDMEYVKMNDTQKALVPGFRLFLATNLPRPQFSPEVFSQTILLDFSITQSALSEQLLALVCEHEIPVETEEKKSIVTSCASYVKELQECEDKILDLLRNSGDHILENETVINSLTQSKQLSEEIGEKLNISQNRAEEIIENQKKYTSVADLSSVLYFCVSDLSIIEHMYVFSMEWFINIFLNALEQANTDPNEALRCHNLIQTFRKQLFNETTLSLFEKDKLLFSFNVSLRLLQHSQGVDSYELKFLLTGYLGTPEEELRSLENPIPHTIDEKLWREICELSSLPGLRGLKGHITEHPGPWVAYIAQPLGSITSIEQLATLFPPPFNDPEIPNLQKLCLFRVTRPEDMLFAIKVFIADHIGDYYLAPPLLELEKIHNTYNQLTPLIFVLSPGNDPQNRLAKFANKEKQELVSISLGKGQEEKAKRKLRDNMATGGWVLLQNCHLALSWLPELERIVQDECSSVHPKFRLWLTTISHPDFPITILHSGIKIITESPKGLVSNLKAIYKSIKGSREDSELFYSSTEPVVWRKLLFSLCFFHCLIRERRKFGSLGWNIHYEFNESDLNISMKQLKIMLDQHNSISFKSLNYLVSECNYGGRITDDWDRLCLRTILKEFYSPHVLEDSYCANGLKQYTFPCYLESLDDYLQFIDKLPSADDPEVYGLHKNANITYARNDTSEFFQRILGLQANSTNSSQESQTFDSIKDEILKTLPNEFNLETAKGKYALEYKQSLNIVLQQELGKFNVLITAIKRDIEELTKALSGFILMNYELEQLNMHLQNNKIPENWRKYSFATRKPLISWVFDIAKRHEFFSKWLSEGLPRVFWISGFFFQQAFLTAILQNEARTNPSKPPVDSLSFEFRIRDDIECDDKWNVRDRELSSEGCLICGLFIEGAKWDAATKSLDDPTDRILFSVMPVIEIIPKLNVKQPKGSYKCPVYKTTARSGSLSTTGHSTNYVCAVFLPTVRKEKYWIQRGVALVTQLP